MQFLGGSFGKQFQNFSLVEWQLLCCSTHVIYRFYFVTMFWEGYFSPATSESEKNTLHKQTVAAMNHGNVGIPPFAFLLVLLIK